MIECSRKMKIRSVYHKMKNHYQLLKDNFFQNLESTVKAYETRMNPKTSALEKSAFFGLDDPGYYGCFYPWFVLGYYMPDSPRYHDKKLLEYAVSALEKYETYIHEDGSVDLIETNFHDPAQTGCPL